MGKGMGRVSRVSPHESVYVPAHSLWLGHLYVCLYVLGVLIGSIAMVLHSAQNPPLLGPFLHHSGKKEEFYPLSLKHRINFVAASF